MPIWLTLWVCPLLLHSRSYVNWGTPNYLIASRLNSLEREAALLSCLFQASPNSTGASLTGARLPTPTPLGCMGKSVPGAYPTTHTRTPHRLGGLVAALPLQRSGARAGENLQQGCESCSRRRRGPGSTHPDVLLGGGVCRLGKGTGLVSFGYSYLTAAGLLH
ncbi:hypothetical protein B0J13DRAFT_296716 [Dactylonectria estremocensis]|uniref:Secreted protein n=1 Tax=Dactylonectria estremocensis TaxID=1079267 RepID=A0A9P9J877_9HYPO|nr:hypothetical protein B0J13DRAFT_296716 [Dactylonectria estremocensis]